MCTSIIEIARADGVAKRGDEWFPLSQTVVAYDHARHAQAGDVITLDFKVRAGKPAHDAAPNPPVAPNPPRADTPVLVAVPLPPRNPDPTPTLGPT